MYGELRQRRPQLHVPRLTETARDQECTIRREGVCNFRTDTTVWCHSPREHHGKGKGLKAHDPFGAWGCSACHDWLDRGRDPERFDVFDRARDETLYQLFAQKLLKVT